MATYFFVPLNRPFKPFMIITEVLWGHISFSIRCLNWFHLQFISLVGRTYIHEIYLLDLWFGAFLYIVFSEWINMHIHKFWQTCFVSVFWECIRVVCFKISCWLAKVQRVTIYHCCYEKNYFQSRLFIALYFEMMSRNSFKTCPWAPLKYVWSIFLAFVTK